MYLTLTGQLRKWPGLEHPLFKALTHTVHGIRPTGGFAAQI
jgi:hypothetical protein